jgi:hypothetical protein
MIIIQLIIAISLQLHIKLLLGTGNYFPGDRNTTKY